MAIINLYIYPFTHLGSKKIQQKILTFGGRRARKPCIPKNYWFWKSHAFIWILFRLHENYGCIFNEGVCVIRDKHMNGTHVTLHLDF